MRISDWSSDVCSSDLKDVAATVGDGVVRNVAPRRARPIGRHVSSGHQLKGGAAIAAEANGKHRLILRRKIEEDRGEAGRKRPDRRSEEHTSELQSLMRN